MTEVAEPTYPPDERVVLSEPDGPQDDEPDAEEAEAQEEAGETAAAQPAALSEDDIENGTKALEHEATEHANRISEIMGEAAQDLVPCELCWPKTPGFHWPHPEVPIEDAQREAVLAAIGQGPDDAPSLREAEGVVMCDRCDGWGELTYPTRRAHTEKQPCPRCLGTGYREAVEPSSVSLTLAPTTAGTGLPAAAPANPCVLCGQAGMQGQPHWCVPIASAGG